MSDSSSESDNIGYLAEESDHDDSDASEESSSDSAHNGFLDLEAADSENESSDSGHSSDGFGLWQHDRELHSFPQFKLLPAELRALIWEFFCPDLTVKSRVFSFSVPLLTRGQWDIEFMQGPHIEQQTRAVRAMLAVHHESRQLALKAFPDTLSFGRNGAIVRFNANLDIIYLHTVRAAVPKIPGFSEHIRHLAMDAGGLSRIRDLPVGSAFFEPFENLKTVYYVLTAADHYDPSQLRWCTSNLARQYRVTTFEEEPGLGEDSQHLYCWPDIENHPGLDVKEMPVHQWIFEWFEGAHGVNIKEALPPGVELRPMVEFFLDLDSDVWRFEQLKTMDGEVPSDWWSLSEDSDSVLDEYESEGIDDSDISGYYYDSEFGSDLAVLDDDGSDHDEEGSEDDSSADSGSPHVQHQAETVDLTGDDHDDVPGPVFSSPDQSSSTVRQSDDSESDQPALSRPRMKRPRGRVAQSDSDEGSESEEDRPRKRARTSKRRDLVVHSDGDDEDDRRKMRPNRRARAVISEDEDDDDNDAGNGEGQDSGADWSGISSSDEDEDEEPAGGARISRPMSLVEKLQLHRQRVSIPPSDDGDSDVGETASDDYDAENYADSQDEGESKEVSEGDDDVQDRLIMDDEDEEYEDDEY
ncbi:hypothetical protein VTK56DRAFT_6006 [Thermocarpiscus australiensis]